MIRIILLDVDNTLLDFNRCAAGAMEAGFRELGLPFRPEMLPVFLSINNRLWYEIEQGRLTRDGLHQIRWPWIFDKLGLTADGVAFERRFGQLLHESHEPVEGAPELLEYLSGKYALYVASNAAAEQQAHRLALAGMLPRFRGLFVSQEIGAAKPSREFFQRCMERLGNPPKDEVLLIGDSLTADIAGGAAFGLRTCWYDHDRLPHDAAPEADYIVDHLLEIPRFL